MKATLLQQQDHCSKLFIAYKAPSSQSSSEWLTQVDSAIENALGASKLTIPQLASELFISERQLFRRLKKLTGKTPNAYLLNFKLQKARQLIYARHSNTLKAICAEIGFKRVDYFSRLFEQEFGVRPVELLERW